MEKGSRRIELNSWLAFFKKLAKPIEKTIHKFLWSSKKGLKIKKSANLICYGYEFILQW